MVGFDQTGYVVDNGLITNATNPMMAQHAPPVDDVVSFTKCDCVSYTYFSLSLILFSVGTITTLLICDESSGISYNNLGHLWLIGPILICIGLTLSLKSMMHLRKKSAIELYRRALLQEIASQHADLSRIEHSLDSANAGILRASSIVTLPPSYEQIVSLDVPIRQLINQATPTSIGYAQQSYNCEMPPPSYDEALSLVNHTTSNSEHKQKVSLVDEHDSQKVSNKALLQQSGAHKP